MVLDDRHGEGVAIDVHVLVGDVDPVVGRQVTEEIDALVEMVDGVGLVADQVVEAVGRVGVDKAIADPFGGFDPVFLVLVSASYSMSLQIETCRRKKKRLTFR